MSQTTTIPGPTASRPRRPHIAPHTWAYRKLTSMRVALGLLFVFALLTLAGTLLAQAPPEVRDNPAAYAGWLNEVRPKYGGWTDVLDVLGLFTVFTSIWFKATVALLVASIVTCSVRRLPSLWRTATSPRMVMTKAFFERAPHRASLASEGAPAATVAAVRAAFRRNHFRTAIERDGEDVHVCADRFRWGPFGRVLAHLSFVLIIAGAVVTASGGFRNEAFAVPVGDKLNVGHGTGLAVEAKSFADSYYTSGPPRDYESHIVVYKHGVPVKAQEIRVNDPLTYDGVTFYQSFFGPAAEVRATAAGGHVLFNRGVPLLYQSEDGRHQIGKFDLARQGLTVYVVTAVSGEEDRQIPPGEAQFEIYRSGVESPIGLRVVSQDKPVRIAGVDFTFLREREFTGLIVAKDPGWNLVWIGATLLIIGIFTVFFFPHRRIRAVIRPGAGGNEVGIAAIDRRREAFADQFEEIVDDIRRAVARAGRVRRGDNVDAENL